MEAQGRQGTQLQESPRTQCCLKACAHHGSSSFRTGTACPSSVSPDLAGSGQSEGLCCFACLHLGHGPQNRQESRRRGKALQGAKGCVHMPDSMFLCQGDWQMRVPGRIWGTQGPARPAGNAILLPPLCSLLCPLPLEKPCAISLCVFCDSLSIVAAAHIHICR